MGALIQGNLCIEKERILCRHLTVLNTLADLGGGGGEGQNGGSAEYKQMSSLLYDSSGQYSPLTPAFLKWETQSMCTT